MNPTKGEIRKQRQAEHAARQVEKQNRTTAEVMLDWSSSRNRRRARVAREYWDAYENGRPMGSDDY
jgi:hypothetical protein